MKFKIEIECSGRSFQEDPNEEVARILQKVVSRLEDGNDAGSLWDTNGNRVGDFRFIPDPPPVLKKSFEEALDQGNKQYGSMLKRLADK